MTVHKNYYDVGSIADFKVALKRTAFGDLAAALDAGAALGYIHVALSFGKELTAATTETADGGKIDIEITAPIILLPGDASRALEEIA